MSDEENKEESFEEFEDDDYGEDGYYERSIIGLNRVFDEVLLSYMTTTRQGISRQSPYYTYQSSSIFVPQSADMNFRYSSTLEGRISNNMRLLNESFLDSIIDRIVDPVESVLNESFNERQPGSIEKINEEIDIDSFKYKSLEKKEKDCCICLDDFSEEDDVSFSKCHHLFHTKCIKEWSTYRTTCPVCRENFEE